MCGAIGPGATMMLGGLLTWLAVGAAAVRMPALLTYSDDDALGLLEGDEAQDAAAGASAAHRSVGCSAPASGTADDGDEDDADAAGLTGVML